MRGEAYPLDFSAGKCRVGTVQRQVGKSGCFQKMQTFFQPGSRVFHGFNRGEAFQAFDKLECGGNVHREEIADGLAAEFYGEGARAQAKAAAGVAGRCLLKGKQARAQEQARRCFRRLFQIGEYAFEGARRGLAASVFQEKFAFAAPVENQRARFRVEGFPRFFQQKRYLLGELTQPRIALRNHLFRTVAPGLDRSVFERFFRVGNDEFRQEFRAFAESAAVWAGAVGMAFGKVFRSERIVGFSAELAGKIEAQGNFSGFAEHDGKGAVFAFTESEFERVGEAGTRIGGNDKAIDDDVEREGRFFFKLGKRVVDVENFAVDADALETAPAEIFDFVGKQGAFDLCVGRAENELGACGKGAELVEAIVEGAARDFTSVVRAKLRSRDGPEQAGVVGDFRSGGDGRARVVIGGAALLDRDDGRKAVDEIDVRARDLFEIGAHFRRKAFEILARALGVNGVECERRLPGTGNPGKHHELVARNPKLEVLQIVFPRTLDADILGRCFAHAGLALTVNGVDQRLVALLGLGVGDDQNRMNHARHPEEDAQQQVQHELKRFSAEQDGQRRDQNRD